MADLDIIIRAQIAAMLSATDGFSPLPWTRTTAIVCGAIEDAAARPGALDGDADGVKDRLTIVGVTALYTVRAGMVERQTLIKRIEDLPKDQQYAYSLRIEHDLSNAGIAKVMGIAEDAAIALILRALMTLAGTNSDGTRNN
jgi:DNA-directed RNA polymerase specialized sigma24 family protein